MIPVSLLAITPQMFAEVPENFRVENLVPWCFVPFDAAKRSPAERAKMLEELGLTRSAYDWRQEQVASFEEEILQYQKHGIEYFAFWSSHEAAFDLFRKYDLRPQIWKTIYLPEEKASLSQSQKVEYAVDALLPLARQARAIGSKLGIYNHGGWGGEPENMVAVTRALNLKLGAEPVGIVYNFHHGHDHIDDFPESLKRMLPYLLCLNLNGMVSAEEMAAERKKILPIGSGTHELEMIRTVLESGYAGPVGILDHLPEIDAKVALKHNIEGLAKVLETIQTENAR